MTREEFKNIFDTHFTSVRNYIYYRSGDKELATDVAQESFIKIWEKNPELVNGNVKALLFKIAGDLLISHIRKQQVIQKYKAISMADELCESPDEVMHYKELLKNYESALEKLPEKQRTVFLMSRMDGLKYKEIADQIGISMKAVEKRMNYALDTLKKAIGS